MEIPVTKIAKEDKPEKPAAKLDNYGKKILPQTGEKQTLALSLIGLAFLIFFCASLLNPKKNKPKQY